MSLVSRIRGFRPSRALVAGALAAATAAGALLVTAGPANAAESSDEMLFPKIDPFLDVQVPAGSGDGAPVLISTISEYRNDVWWFEPVLGNTYRIHDDANLAECLTTDNIAGHAVYQAPCVSNATNRLWISNIVPGETTPRSYHAASSGLYLDVPHNLAADGVVLDTWYYNGNDNQFFYSRKY